MKIRVDGMLKGEPVFVEWEDGFLSGSSDRVVERVRIGAFLRALKEGFPTPNGFEARDEGGWLSHPRGFVLSARRALENVSTDWVDHEMKGVVLIR